MTRRPIARTLAGMLALVLATSGAGTAGGPLGVGGTVFGAKEGQPILWSTAAPIEYRTDGGTLGLLTTEQANARVADMFQVWQDVATATIAYTRVGDIQPVGVFTDGDVSTIEEYDAVNGDCILGNQNPVIYDADGSIFDSLFGPGNPVVGIAGPCRFSSGSGSIEAGKVVMNGRFLDGDAGNGEVTDARFNAAIIHEIGHFNGLDHAQTNLHCLLDPGNCTAGQRAAVATMFPILISDDMATLGQDDIAWISRLYPAPNFNTSFATLSGTVRFSDGISHAQGVNVVIRGVDDPNTPGEDESLRVLTVVSGYRFTEIPGQDVTGDAPPGSWFFGSVAPLLIGFWEISVPPGQYTVEVEAIHPAFVGGSGVGPFFVPFPLPGGTPEFWNGDDESATDDPAAFVTITVSAGETVSGIDIILNGTEPRFDQFEDSDVAPAARLYLPPRWNGRSQPPWTEDLA